jgi:hypothetical protein
MQPFGPTVSAVNEAEYYKWISPSGELSILLRLDLVDSILSEVMAAFSALPRRGAETGGILLGRVEPGTRTTVRIEGFAPVPCSYRRGPSYLLSESDLAAFEAAAGKHAGGEETAIGYYRSHTRDRESVSEEDRVLCSRFFPPPSGIMLLIQPRVTRVSTAGFLGYENGVLPDWPQALFPFRTRELDGRQAPVRAPHTGIPAGPETPVSPRLKSRGRTAPVAHEFSFSGYARHEQEAERRRGPARRTTSWFAVLVAVLCLLIAIAAGIFARPFLPMLNPPDHDPFVISLSAMRADNKLVITWDRDSPAVRYAQEGRLQIVDGQFTKTLELSPMELRTGSVLFHNSGEHVSVRLEVLVHRSSTLVEAIQWDYAPVR